MSLEKVQSGQPMRIKADTFNSIIDATRAYKERQQSGGRSAKADAPRDASTVLVRNDGVNPVYLGYGLYPLDPVIGPTDNLNSFKFQPVFSCDTTAGPEPTDRFFVAMEPIGVGKIGLAAASGGCLARINLTDSNHRFVKLCSDTTNLRSAVTGGAQILWIDSWTPGTRWALVRLGLPLQEKPLPEGVLENMHYILKSYGGVIQPTWDFSIVF